MNKRRYYGCSRTLSTSTITSHRTIKQEGRKKKDEQLAIILQIYFRVIILRELVDHVKESRDAISHISGLFEDCNTMSRYERTEKFLCKRPSHA